MSFTKEEVRDARWGLVADKLPGPDRFDLGFIIISWDTVKDNLLRLMKEVWRGGQIGLSEFLLSYGNTQERGTKSVGDYRLITLLISQLKIVVKVLTN